MRACSGADMHAYTDDNRCIMHVRVTARDRHGVKSTEMKLGYTSVGSNH
jgi:hypothetical protein